MTKEELLEVEGVVTPLLPNLMSRVVLDNGKEIRHQLGAAAAQPHQTAGRRSGDGRDDAL